MTAGGPGDLGISAAKIERALGQADRGAGAVATLIAILGEATKVGG